MAEKSIILIQQENLELKKECQALQEVVGKLIDEVNRLQGIEFRPIVTNNTETIIKTTEEDIIDEQIKRLDVVSRERMFTLEETRALDLLVKNKRLLDPYKAIEPDYTKVPEGQTESDLLRIAGNVSTEHENSGEINSRTKTSS